MTFALPPSECYVNSSKNEVVVQLFVGAMLLALCYQEITLYNTFRAMDFSVDAPVGAKGDAIQKEQVMEQVKAQIAVANAQELLQVSDIRRQYSN